jgi:hypothetical protein
MIDLIKSVNCLSSETASDPSSSSEFNAQQEEIPETQLEIDSPSSTNRHKRRGEQTTGTRKKLKGDAVNSVAADSKSAPDPESHTDNTMKTDSILTIQVIFLNNELYRAERAFQNKDIAYHQLKYDNEILEEKTKEHEVTIATLRAKVESLESSTP